MTEQSVKDDLEVVVNLASEGGERTILGEGPWWDSKKQVLYFIDIRGLKVHEYSPKSKTTKTVNLTQKPGCVVASTKGTLIVAAEKGFHELDMASGRIEKIVHPEEDQQGNRFNDGKCDPKGRLIAGTMEDAETGKMLGSIYCLNEKRQVKKLWSQIGISNGLEWSADHKTMYYIDSVVRSVDAFDYDVNAVTLSNRRTIIKIENGFPDGMTIDEEGMLWVCHWGGNCVTRWNPHTGKLLRTVQLPVSKVTSCVFGGEKLDVLYITTASYQVDPNKEPLAGAVFLLKNPLVRGVSNPYFVG